MSLTIGIYSRTDIIFLIHIFTIITLHSAFVNSEPAQTTSQLVTFKCPEQFGYYADNSNCSKYFVCVFGEPLHESCTGGLRFSSELQTCDWPRNVVCLAEESKPNTFRNEEQAKKDSDRNTDGLYDYNGEEIQPIINNQNEENLRNVQDSYEELLKKNSPNSNNNPIRNNNNNDNNEDYSLDLQRSRSVVSNSQERNFGAQLIGRSISGNRHQQSVGGTGSEPTITDLNVSNNPIQTEPQKNNRVTVDDLQSPNFEEAIAAIIDENGGVHLNDGPGSLFSLVSQDSGQPGQDVSVFVKQLNTDLKSNTRRGLPQNQIVLINRTQLVTQPSSRTNNRFQSTQRQLQHQFFPHHQVISTPFDVLDNNNPKAPEQQRTNTRSPRQRIHIIVNNRTTVQEIPIEDQIDFQRITVTPSTNRYSNQRIVDHRRQPLTITTPIPRTTTPTPRVSTERRVIPETTYLTSNERRIIGTNPRPVNPRLEIISPVIVPVRQETIPQRPPPQYRTPEPYSNAVNCNQRSCRLPDCFCGGTEIPAGLPVNQVPQIVLITFDDAVNDINWHIYEEIFNTGRTNPNGCPIKGTFYVSHEWTDYGQVQTLYSRGHEMASHSVTHSFGERFSKSQWHKEINGQREILHLYGGVNLEDIRGMRAPFLQGGGNKQFEMLYEANFTYDSTMPVFENDPPFWPYTLDFAINHECMIAPCPTKSFPGFWEIGMVMWQDLRGGRCSMGDACSNPTDENGVYEMIMKNFNRHYRSNRAPFGLYYHSAWFNTEHHKRGFMRVIDELLKHKDVYFMTKTQLIQWMRNPKPIQELYNLSGWQCGHNPDRPPPCLQPDICNVGSKSGSRFLKTCQPCPNTYPWVGNTGFAKS